MTIRYPNKFGCIFVGLVYLPFASVVVAQNALTQSGYHPQSWNQILPASERFEELEEPCDSSSGVKCPTPAPVWGILDKETGLVWELSPSSRFTSFEIAYFECLKRTHGNRRGWRLPLAEELYSLYDPSANKPDRPIALPIGHPFTNVQPKWYWSATWFQYGFFNAMRIKKSRGIKVVVNFDSGSEKEHMEISTTSKAYTWCVRGPSLYD